MNYYLANWLGLQPKEVPAVGAVLQWNSAAHRNVFVTDLLPGTKNRREESFLRAFRIRSFLSGYKKLKNKKKKNLSSCFMGGRKHLKSLNILHPDVLFLLEVSLSSICIEYYT